MTDSTDTLVNQQAEADLANRRAGVIDTCTRLEYERCWVLHRALTLNAGHTQDPSENWKGQPNPPATWSEEQRTALLAKYYEELMKL